MKIVTKFGGTSLADAKQIKKAVEIVKKNADRKIIIVSAPGKRNKDDEKITDLLYTCHKLASKGDDFSEPFSIIRRRFHEIAGELGLTVKDTIDEIEDRIKKGAPRGDDPDFAASRGEFICAQFIAELLDARFIDAADMVKLTPDGRVDEISYDLVAQKIADIDKRYIIPGFYGSTKENNIKTFSRGGSDITGAIAARAAKADLYENWTDVSGILMADPRIVDNPDTIREITYREIRELASIGANVFHEEAIAPVRDVRIPINVRNTNEPDAAGTMIVFERDTEKTAVVGVSGKKPYKNLFIEKLMLNRYMSYREDVLNILRKFSIVPEFESKGFDTLSFLIHQDLLDNENEVVRSIKEKLTPDSIAVKPAMALIGVVGEGLENRLGVGAVILSALQRAHINVRFVNYGGSEITFIFGVDLKDYQKALSVVCEAFRPHKQHKQREDR